MVTHRFRVPNVLGLLATLLIAAPAAQAETRIAVVDGRRALISSKEGRKAEKILKSLMESKKKQIAPLEVELKRQREEFESQKYVLSRSAVEDRQLELLKRQRDLERSMREAQDDLEIEQRKLMQPLLKQVEEVVAKLGKKKKFTLILEKSSPGVLYLDDAIDITDLVIQKLNEKK